MPDNVLSLLRVLTHVAITMTPWNKVMLLSPSYSWWEQVTGRLCILPRWHTWPGSAPSQSHSPALTVWEEVTPLLLQRANADSPSGSKVTLKGCPLLIQPCNWWFVCDVIPISVHALKNSCHRDILTMATVYSFIRSPSLSFPPNSHCLFPSIFFLKVVKGIL